MPRKMKEHHMVILDKTDVVVIGGWDGGQLSSLYRMTCQNKECEWETMSQTLKFGRNNFVAMLIPDELTDCPGVSTTTTTTTTMSTTTIATTTPTPGPGK